MPNPIPPITDPLGSHWEQPCADNWLFDDTHVVIPARDLKRMHSYDSTMPTGVYEGKMWQRHEPSRHLLVWYGPCNEPKRCGIYFREILVLEEVSHA